MKFKKLLPKKESFTKIRTFTLGALAAIKEEVEAAQTVDKVETRRFFRYCAAALIVSALAGAFVFCITFAARLGLGF